jgi:hypothetical protein
MNTLLLNRDGFQMPADGWYQVAPRGEFAHAQAGLVQVVDAEACAAMVNRFEEECKGANFAGLLVDFDHDSLDAGKRSEAAGWIVELKVGNRESDISDGSDASGGGAKGQGGLWAKIRWSDVGEEAVKGGRYRFLSPVWARSDCVELGNGRVRPVRLLNAAVTNDPNLKGIRPLSNSGREAVGCRLKAVREKGEEIGNDARGGAEAQRFKWVLGETEGGRHCPSCAAAAGQVHTMAEWDAAGVKPGSAGLCCQGNCKCRLEATGDAVGGVLGDVPVRKKEGEMRNAECGMRSGEGDASRGGAGAQRGGVVANIGWTDAARAASLAVRRAKAAARGDRSRVGKEGGQVAALLAKGYVNMTPDEVRRVGKALQAKAKTGAEFTPEEMQFLQDSIDDSNAIPAARDTGAGKGKTRKAASQRTPDPEPGDGDYRTLFEESGLEKMPPKAVQAYTEQLREKMAAGDEPLDEVEERFLSAITDNGYEGLNPDDPVFQWQVERAKKEQRIAEATGMPAAQAEARVREIETRMNAMEPVTPEEEALCDAYHRAMGMRNRERVRGSWFLVRGCGERATECADFADEERGMVAVLVNAGWTEEARVAALAVRRMKAGMRGQLDLKRKLEAGRVRRPRPLAPRPAGSAQDVRVRPPRRPDERRPGVPPGLRYPAGRAWWRRGG